MTVRISCMHFYDVATIFLRAGGKFSTDVTFYVMPKVYSKEHNLKKFLLGLSRTSAAAKRKPSLNVRVCK